MELWREFDEKTPLDVAWKQVHDWVENTIQQQLDKILATKGRRPVAREEEISPTREETAIPEFAPQELMDHQWKGRKIAEGKYGKGSLVWGWDFANAFPDGVIKLLEKGPFTIDKYEFSLNPAGNLVQTKTKSRS